MYTGIPGQKERLRKYIGGQYLDALILGAKGRVHKDGVQRYF